MFIGLLLGSLFAELFCSGRLSDWIVQKISERHGGMELAERRLWLAYPAAFLSASESTMTQTEDWIAIDYYLQLALSFGALVLTKKPTGSLARLHSFSVSNRKQTISAVPR